MELKEYTAATLKQAIQTPVFWQTGQVPITPQRAISQLHNPRADPEDLLLLSGYEEGELVAYMGILPDQFMLGTNRVKVGWLSTWWVNPMRASRGLGSRLLARALESYGDHIAIVSATPPAARIYDASGHFNTLRMTAGLHVHVQSDTWSVTASWIKRLLRRSPGGRQQVASGSQVAARPPRAPGPDQGFRRKSRTRFVRPVFRVLDAFRNGGMRARLQAWLHRENKAGPAPTLQYIPEIDAETSAFIGAYRKQELVSRGPDELNWAIHYPWVVPAPLGDRLEHKYFFSAVAKRFLIHNVKVFDAGGEMIGFLMLKVRDSGLAVPYSYFRPGQAPAMMTVILRHLIKLRLGTLYLYDGELIRAFQERQFPCFGREPVVRRSFISRVYDKYDTSACVLQDGDGDGVFT